MSRQNLVSFFVLTFLTFGNPVLSSDGQLSPIEKLAGAKVTLTLRDGSRIPNATVLKVDESPIGCLNAVTVSFTDDVRKNRRTITYEARTIEMLKSDKLVLEYEPDSKTLVDSATAQRNRQRIKDEKAAAIAKANQLREKQDAEDRRTEAKRRQAMLGQLEYMPEGGFIVPAIGARRVARPTGLVYLENTTDATVQMSIAQFIDANGDFQQLNSTLYELGPGIGGYLRTNKDPLRANWVELKITTAAGASRWKVAFDDKGSGV